MINKETASKLISFLIKYKDFYKDFLKLEQKKYNIISENRINELDDCVKDEQAFILKSKGLEIERESLMKNSGHPNLTFKELIALFPDDQKELGNNLFNEFSDVILDFKKINNLCNELTQLRLHKIEVKRKQLEHQPETQKVYDATALEAKNKHTFLSKKI